jgi:hypothetical protein
MAKTPAALKPIPPWFAVTIEMAIGAALLAAGMILVDRFRNSNHMSRTRGPRWTPENATWQLIGFMESTD